MEKLMKHRQQRPKYLDQELGWFLSWRLNSNKTIIRMKIHLSLAAVFISLKMKATEVFKKLRNKNRLNSRKSR